MLEPAGLVIYVLLLWSRNSTDVSFRAEEAHIFALASFMSQSSDVFYFLRQLGQHLRGKFFVQVFWMDGGRANDWPSFMTVRSYTHKRRAAPWNHDGNVVAMSADISQAPPPTRSPHSGHIPTPQRDICVSFGVKTTPCQPQCRNEKVACAPRYQTRAIFSSSKRRKTESRKERHCECSP